MQIYTLIQRRLEACFVKDVKLNILKNIMNCIIGNLRNLMFLLEMKANILSNFNLLPLFKIIDILNNKLRSYTEFLFE